MKTNKKIIKSDKQVDTYLFCEKVKQQSKEFNEKYDDLMSKEDLDNLQGGLKVLNLEDDEDISHHRLILGQNNDMSEYNPDNML